MALLFLLAIGNLLRHYGIIIANGDDDIMLDDPRMVQSLLQRHALLRIRTQHTRDEVRGLGANITPILLGKVILAPKHASMGPIVVRAVERGIPAQEDVRNHPHGPEVAGFIVLLPQDFRGDVVGRAHDGAHGRLPPRTMLPGQSEVDDLDGRIVLGGFEQDVLRLDVPVRDSVLVHVAQCGQDL